MRALRRTLALALPLAALALVGCAETARYVYTPTEHATARLPENGLPAALYQVPPEAPQGEVKVASLGVRKLDTGNLKGRYLVARVVVSNNSDQPWSFDGSQQQASIAGGPPQGPVSMFAAEQPTSWVVTVPPRQQRAFDLVYAVGDSRVTNFQLAWSIGTPQRWITERTNFRRDEVAEPAYAYGAPYGYGFYYGAYYDPFYPWGYGPSIMVHPRPYYHRSYGWRSAPPPMRVAPPPPVRVPAPPPRVR